MIRIRSTLTAQRHALAVLGTIFALGLTVALAHGVPGADHMGGTGSTDDSHAGHSAIVTMCLAVVEAGGAGLLGLALWRAIRRRRLPDPERAQRPRYSSPSRNIPVPRVRAGPAVLQVYRL